MKRVLMGVVLATAVSAVWADGYVGAAYGNSKAGVKCDSGMPCDHRASNPFKIYGGTKIADLPNFGMEVSYIRFGSFDAQHARQVYDVGAAATVDSHENHHINARAITAALVGRYEPVSNLNLVGRVGLAYSIASVDYAVMSVNNGAASGYVSNGSQTSSKVKPYLGVGVEYDIKGIVKVALAYDWSQYSVAEEKGNVSLWSLGVQKDF